MPNALLNTLHLSKFYTVFSIWAEFEEVSHWICIAFQDRELWLSSLDCGIFHSSPFFIASSPLPPPLHVPLLRGWGGVPMEGGSFNITSACISLPQARHSGVPRGAEVPGRALAPPRKYKIKRKLRLKSNTWQWQRLRICIHSLFK